MGDKSARVTVLRYKAIRHILLVFAYFAAKLLLQIELGGIVNE